MARSTVLISGAATFSILAYGTTALAVDCFVDSVGGSDTNNGTTETSAWKSVSKLTSSCTVVKFKRGSVFNVPTGSFAVDLMTLRNIKTLTNYGDTSLPLPQFIKPHVASSGGMLQAYAGNITIDGLYLSGSRSDAAMSNLAQGICVMLGANSTIINSEITLCDIGMMTAGDNVTVRNNYVHDLSISVDAPPGVDPNQVGGAEGIFVNSSHVEVSYNRFVNCSTAAQWVSNTSGGGVRCDGGATEVTVPYAGTVTDVHIHHNFSYNSCGFFEVSSMPSTGSGAYVKGKFTNSEFHDNVSVDSGWISLLQINNTKLTNVRWENNTIVHHFLPTVTDAAGTSINMNDFASSYIQVIAFNSTSSGVTGGGELSPGDVYWTNNLWYIDPAITNFSPTDATHTSTDQFVKNIVMAGDKVFRTDPGFVDITSKTDPSAYNLTKVSAAIDQGVTNSDITTDVATDFLDRPRPVGAAFDLGAFEYQNSTSGGSSGTGGTSASVTGGAPATGGTAAKATGGAAAVGGSGTKATGGAPTDGTGGVQTVATGGAPSTGGVAAIGGAGTKATGGAPTVATGGSPNAGGAVAIGGSGTGGSQPSGIGGASSTAVATSATGGAGTATTTGGAVSDSGSCSCRIPGKQSRSGTVSWVALLMLGWGLRLRSKRSSKNC
jgi:hypothetical protein